MKTEFNVERVCERVHMCYVEAPEELGQALIEIRRGSVHVSFPNYQRASVATIAEEPADVPSLRSTAEPDQTGNAVDGNDATPADSPAPTNPGRGRRRGK